METILQNALPGTLPREVGNESVFHLVWNLIAKATLRNKLSREESVFLELVRKGAETYGASVIEATSQQDLKDRIAAVAEAPSFNAYWRDVRNTVVAMGDELWMVSTRSQNSTDSRALLESVLSGGAFPRMEQGLKYLDVYARIMPTWMEQIRAMGPDTGEEPTMSWMDIIDDQDVPAELAEALYEAVCGLVVTLALNAAILREHKLQPWLSLALAERWSQGLKSDLRLMATNAAIAAELPESVLPLEERIDVDAVNARHAQAEKAFRALNAAAERAGEPVYPAGI